MGIKYRDGYDGQLVNNAAFQLPENLHPKKDIQTEFLGITKDGWMTFKAAYAWDYASVPFTHWLSNKIAGKKSKTPSLIHDGLCQLHRQGYMPHDPERVYTDEHFYQLLLERKFWKIRAWLWFKAVRIGAKYHKQKPKKEYTAP